MSFPLWTTQLSSWLKAHLILSTCLCIISSSLSSLFLGTISVPHQLFLMQTLHLHRVKALLGFFNIFPFFFFSFSKPVFIHCNSWVVIICLCYELAWSELARYLQASSIRSIQVIDFIAKEEIEIVNFEFLFLFVKEF